jgi:hypothetical protein
MILDYMTYDALNELKLNFQQNMNHYHNNDRSWFLKYLEKCNGLQKSKIECEDIKLDFSEDYNESDYKNIIILYSALKTLPLTIAADERVWAGLAHGQFWNYVQHRRKMEIESNIEQDIKNSFFFTRGIKRSAHIHCISRLWWAGHLTYDSSRSNPFELTRILCQGAFASTVMLLSSSNFTANKELCLGLLSSIKKLEDEGVKIKREHFVESTKYLNSMGAVTILDCLTREEVESLIDKYFEDKYGVIGLSEAI